MTTKSTFEKELEKADGRRKDSFKDSSVVFKYDVKEALRIANEKFEKEIRRKYVIIGDGILKIHRKTHGGKNGK